MSATIGRLLCGFIAQYLGVFVSVNVFTSSGGTIFWWTQSAITMAVMLHTSDRHWPERVVHGVSGLVSYIAFRYKKFSVPLLAAVCASNGLGQAFGYVSMKQFYPVLSPTDVGTLRFLGVYLLFPVITASLVASIPGSLGFYFLGTDVEVSSVIVNYTLGHISGTATLLYPLIIIPVMWKDRPRSNHSLMYGTSVFVIITVLCAFTNYFIFGFATIVVVYGLHIWISAYMHPCDASMIQLASTGTILGLTSAGRGPFVYVIKDGGSEAVLIGTQMGITALVAVSAFIVILVSQLRDLEKSERESRRHTEDLIERQTLGLFRIGHDMKNNSTLVQAICETMLEGGTEDALEIVKAINVLNGVLISDMVDMVGGTNTDRVVSREDVDVMELMRIYLMVAGGMSLLEGKEKCIVTSLRYTSSESIVPVVSYTNRERLHQVICNLVSNAVKYTERGEIVLEVDGSDGESILIHVADSGIGLSQDDVSKVFDLFYRSERASKVNSGNGLGLSNVKKICDTIDAKIKVSSPGEGKGSTFTLVLPRISIGEKDTRGQKPKGRTRLPLRVLVMDDSLVIRKLMTKYLTALGYEVVDTSSVEESRSLLSDISSGKKNKSKSVNVFDIVITDSCMGGVESGPDFIRSIRDGRVKGLSRCLPCILCSGEHHHQLSDADDTQTIAITKPFSSADVASALDELTTTTTSSEEDAKV